MADNVEQAAATLDALEGNLTGCIYSDTACGDDALYDGQWTQGDVAKA